MSDGEVKRYFPHTYHGGDVVQPSMEENEHGAWVKNEDHERVVAELKAQLEHSETKVTWLLRDNERVVKEKDEAYNKLDDINMALNEKIASQKRVIEKLKLAITDIANKNTCWRLYEIDKYKSYEDGWEGVAEFAGKVLNELEAIEKGER